MSVRPSDVRKLYKALLRHSSRFTDYNFREYALRRTRESFRANRSVTDVEALNRHYYDGLNNLNIIKRQASISQMFKTDPVIIEN